MSNTPDRATKYVALVDRMESPRTLEMHLRAVMDALQLDREEAIHKLYAQYVREESLPAASR